MLGPIYVGIFDADGTLFDNMNELSALFADIILEKYQFKNPQTAREEFQKIYKRIGGMPIEEQFKKVMLEETGIIIGESEINEMADDFRFRLLKDPPVQLFPETEKVLTLLYQRGFKLFVSSGARQSRLEKMINVIRPNWFSACIGTNPGIKKGIAHFMYFAGRMANTLQEFASKSFLLSDSPIDIKLANQYGILPIGITNSVSAEELKSSGAKFVISQITELPQLIKDINTALIKNEQPAV